MAEVATSDLLGKAQGGGGNIVKETEGVCNAAESFFYGKTRHAFGSLGHIIIDLGELGNRVSVGDTHEDHNPLAVVAAGIFGLGHLVSGYAITIYAKHLIGEMVDGASGATVRGIVVAETGKIKA